MKSSLGSLLKSQVQFFMCWRFQCFSSKSLKTCFFHTTESKIDSKTLLCQARIRYDLVLMPRWPLTFLNLFWKNIFFSCYLYYSMKMKALFSFLDSFYVELASVRVMNPKIWMLVCPLTSNCVFTDLRTIQIGIIWKHEENINSGCQRKHSRERSQSFHFLFSMWVRHFYSRDAQKNYVLLRAWSTLMDTNLSKNPLLKSWILPELNEGRFFERLDWRSYQNYWWTLDLWTKWSHR